ncbi:hypothetical protein IAI10_10555 [Clostridium sp. 19966]|uniref:hypothetical protein n=1 Tax=Clostridium sp. 19966 TaxID=2768166 RepID=UPI0028DF20F8|nr:hypothetical protein [Clostridium sp. 19966]MDT8717098.1 hypothetical protein [Clostridium sp. 19966]
MSSYRGSNDIIGSGILFIIALFFLSCSGCGNNTGYYGGSGCGCGGGFGIY